MKEQYRQKILELAKARKEISKELNVYGASVVPAPLKPSRSLLDFSQRRSVTTTRSAKAQRPIVSSNQ